MRDSRPATSLMCGESRLNIRLREACVMTGAMSLGSYRLTEADQVDHR
ncbi:MAG: hypothetical protein ACREAB_07270 [Blastocatellia bacterium]